MSYSGWISAYSGAGLVRLDMETLEPVCVLRRSVFQLCNSGLEAGPPGREGVVAGWGTVEEWAQVGGGGGDRSLEGQRIHR